MYDFDDFLTHYAMNPPPDSSDNKIVILITFTICLGVAYYIFSQL